MGITNDNIGDNFNDSILIDYLDNVINSKPLKEVILKLSYKLQIFKENGETETLHAIDKKQLDYIILATKLNTMVQVFNQLKKDDNFDGKLVKIGYKKSTENGYFIQFDDVLENDKIENDDFPIEDTKTEMIDTIGNLWSDWKTFEWI